MKEISLHILDIAENSVNAGATCIEVSVAENIKNDEMVIKIRDNGRGMGNDTVKRITDPFVTSRTTRKVGLGIPFLKAAAEACQGYLKISSEIGKGTEISVKFKHSHIDRMPLGDLKNTYLGLMVGYPEIHWIFRYSYNQNIYEYDDREVKEILKGIALSDPQVLNYLRKEIFEGIDQAKKGN